MNFISLWVHQSMHRDKLFQDSEVGRSAERPSFSCEAVCVAKKINYRTRKLDHVKLQRRHTPCVQQRGSERNVGG
jgi:hypothetical protein